jgi:hypothetical protein
VSTEEFPLLVLELISITHAICYKIAVGSDQPRRGLRVTIDLARNGIGTEVMLAQDHNATEAARIHSEKNWKMMLDGL